MSVLEFVRDLVRSLAWPAVVLILAVAFRQQVLGLLKDRRLKALRVGKDGFNAEFSDGLEEARTEVSAAVTSAAEHADARVADEVPPPASASSEDARERLALLELAAVSPSGAVIEAFLGVEQTLVEFSDLFGAPRRGIGSMTTELSRAEVLSGADVTAIRELAELRNSAAHRRDRRAAISLEQALDYARLCSELVESLLRRMPMVYEAAVVRALKRVAEDFAVERPPGDTRWDAVVTTASGPIYVEAKFVRPETASRRLRDVRARILPGGPPVVAVVNDLPTRGAHVEVDGFQVVRWRGPADDPELLEAMGRAHGGATEVQ